MTNIQAHAVSAMAGVLLAVVAASSAAAQDEQQCRLLLAAQIPIQYEAGGRPTIPVTVNGRTAQFLVDTGGAFSTINQSLVDELKLRTEKLPERMRVTFINGSRVTQLAMTNSFGIGRLNVGTYGLGIQPFAMTPGVDGLLAPEFLHVFDVEFDFAAGKIDIFSQKHCEGHVVHWTHDMPAILSFEPTKENPFDLADRSLAMRVGKNWHINVQGTLDGQDVDVMIDTGASTSYMALEEAKKVIPSDRQGDIKQISPPGGDPDNAVYTYPFKTLNLGGVVVNNPVVRMRPNKIKFATRAELHPGMLLGMDALSKLHIYIAYKEEKLYLTPVDAH